MNSSRLIAAATRTSIIAAACLAALYSVARLQPTADDARLANARAQIAHVNDRVLRYIHDHGRPPASLHQLIEPWADGSPYAREKDLLDPYGRELVYLVPGAHGAFDILSLGKDGKPGGVRYDADFGNWQLPKDP